MGVVRDISGRKFGRLLAIRFVGLNKWNKSIWECQCDCGNTTSVLGHALVGGLTQSCGCAQKELTSKRNLIDLTGKRFGRLTVVGKSTITGAHGEIMWDCICDCGNEKTVLGRSLRDGKTISCKCFHNENFARIKTIHGKHGTKEYMHAKDNRRREREFLYDSQWTMEMDSLLREMFPSCVIDGSTRNLSVDHVYPLIDGNGLFPGNATRLCGSCNSKKNKFPPENLPKSLPPDAGQKILESAEKFKNHWYSLHPEKV